MTKRAIVKAWKRLRVLCLNRKKCAVVYYCKNVVDNFFVNNVSRSRFGVHFVVVNKKVYPLLVVTRESVT